MGGPLLFWGFQGTIDHRANLTAGQFEALGMTPPAEDQERFIAKPELSALLDELTRLDISTSKSPGGSPLMSALAADAWLRQQGAEARARFVGARPQGLSQLVPETSSGVFELAEADPRIGGTLALEYRPASAKIMLSVPDGRWLDDGLANRGIGMVRHGLGEMKPSRVAIGIGGLNKASPHAVMRIIREMRQLQPQALVLATGSSFRSDVTDARPADFWPALLEVFASVDVISLSRAEKVQLSEVWGADWIDRLLAAGRLKLAVTHSSKWVDHQAGEAASRIFENPAAIVDTAAQEASRYASRALTGLGARFDGVLSAALLLNLQPIHDKAARKEQSPVAE
jgi:hypothetical protein